MFVLKQTELFSEMAAQAERRVCDSPYFSKIVAAGEWAFR
jgi:hypothetical protein